MFLVGSFLAWREQHRLVLAEQAKNARPEIKGEIKELHVEHEWGGTPPNCDCFVVLRAHLVNYSPAVSTIKDYRLSVTSESGSVYSSSSKLSTYFWQLAKEPVRQYDFTVGTRIIREEIPDLSRLLATVPLERGHGKEGWLAFCMKSQRTEDENMKPKAARLTMIDAFGGEHRVECSSPWETSGTIVERDL